VDIRFKCHELIILGAFIKRELLEITNGKSVTEDRLTNLYEIDSKLKLARKNDEVALVNQQELNDLKETKEELLKFIFDLFDTDMPDGEMTLSDLEQLKENSTLVKVVKPNIKRLHQPKLISCKAYNIYAHEDCKYELRTKDPHCRCGVKLDWGDE
jgi:hypothetical protein